MRARVKVQARLFRLQRAWPGVLWRLHRRLGEPVCPRERGVVITVSLRRRELRLYEDGELCASYRVGVGGLRGRTPQGRFEIGAKVRHPAWTVPDIPERYGELAGRVIPGGAPGNRLGEVWLELYGAIGIHGAPGGRLGLGSTDGCITMSPVDLRALSERVTVGTPVHIG